MNAREAIDFANQRRCCLKPHCVTRFMNINAYPYISAFFDSSTISSQRDTLFLAMVVISFDRF
jgi:hypothetical protein